MKKITAAVWLTSLFILLTVGLVFSSDGTNSCGYEMIVVPVEQPLYLPSSAIPTQPAILDAWTTNDLNNPLEVYDFTYGQDILAFVVKYSHIGGPLPEQWAKGWKCNTEIPLKTCQFTWTIGYLPPGDYLLINYFNPVTYPSGNYDWAAKVGDVVFGWPNISKTRPECFVIHP